VSDSYLIRESRLVEGGMGGRPSRQLCGKLCPPRRIYNCCCVLAAVRLVYRNVIIMCFVCNVVAGETADNILYKCNVRCIIIILPLCYGHSLTLWSWSREIHHLNPTGKLRTVIESKCGGGHELCIQMILEYIELFNSNK